jgi:hypothetical protein
LATDQRYFSSDTIAMDKTQLEEIKNLYREFRKKMTIILESSTVRDEVFQFSFQAFPLTSRNE